MKDKMVCRKPDSKKAKNVMVSISSENWHFARQNGLRWSDLMRTAVAYMREEILREQREQEFDKNFASIIPKLEIYLEEHNIPFVPKKFDRVMELTKVTYTAFPKPLADAKPSIAEYFLDHYKNLVLRGGSHLEVPDMRKE